MTEELQEDLRLRPASDFTEGVKRKFHPEPTDCVGTKFRISKLPFMWIPGETSLWTGYNGHGKSALLNQFILDQAVCGINSALASFEMPAIKNLYRMVRQALGKANPTNEEIEKCMAWLGKRVFIYDKTGVGSLQALKRTFNRARAVHKVTFFVVDSLMKCGIDPKDLGAQKNFMDEWQDFAQTYGVNVNIVAHSKKGEDEDTKPGKMDVAGAMELTNLPDNVYSIWRNKRKEALYREYLETKVVRGMTFEKLLSMYDCTIDCSKNRELGGDGEGMYGLYFHKPSMQFTASCGENPYVYYE